MNLRKVIIVVSLALNIGQGIFLHLNAELDADIQAAMFQCDSSIQHAIYGLKRCEIILGHYHEILSKHEEIVCKRKCK